MRCSCLRFLDYTKEASIDRLGEIGQALFPNVSYTKEEGADVLIEAIKQLCIDLEIPNLQSWGIDRQLFYAAVEKMAADAIQNGSPANHPGCTDGRRNYPAVLHVL